MYEYHQKLAEVGKMELSPIEGDLEGYGSTGRVICLSS